jgi:hypothetical protein
MTKNGLDVYKRHMERYQQNLAGRQYNHFILFGENISTEHSIIL